MIPQKKFKFSPILFHQKTEEAISILSSVFCTENEISFYITKQMLKNIGSHVAVPTNKKHANVYL